MATLDLSREETESLTVALQSYLNDLQDEIGHTDDYDFRQALQARREHLEGILARLSSS